MNLRTGITVVSTWLMGLAGCGAEPLEFEPAPCGYPAGPDEMALGEVLPAYQWPVALHRDGRTGDLALGDVHCNTDADVDWSPFDVLLFVSIPAW